MLPERCRIAKKTSERLKSLKYKTGLAPNIMARVALTRSLARGTDISLPDAPLDGMKFDSPTLFGEYALLYEQLLTAPGDDAETLNLKIAAHIQNGIADFRRIHNLLELIKQ